VALSWRLLSKENLPPPLHGCVALSWRPLSIERPPTPHLTGCVMLR
jgi:hypothetical protein